ncbi:hypothetical protein [Sorangium sp. So ce1153]|uniref:hypothetical protein n=1 Tax=Sorangium sp. So ce1153 TaxID=3133333 RepID=UPI003F60DF8B
MILYRPVGLEELLLVYRSSMREFPSRLPGQPIFYPVLTVEYARQIARKWNAASGSQAGYVIQFDIDDNYGKSFPVRQVGSLLHQELWVPASSLDEFNDHITGPAQLVDAFFGSEFSGIIPGNFSLRGKDAREQFASLQIICEYSLMDLHGEITANHEAIFAHYPYWEQLVGQDAVHEQDGRALLSSIRRIWSGAFPDISLGVQSPWTSSP